MELFNYERLLFKERPRSFTVLGFLFLIIGVVLIAIIIDSHISNNIYENKTISAKRYLEASIFTILGFVFLFFRFIVTTHRVAVEVCSFTLMQTLKEQLTDNVQLQVPLNSQFNDKLRNKYKIFRQNKSDAEYWSKHGQLIFPNNQKASLFNRNLNHYPLLNFSKKQCNEIFIHLQQYWNFDPNHINRSSNLVYEKKAQQNDIGNAPIAIILGSLLIPVLSHLLITTQLESIHIQEESYGWISIFIILGIIISYIIIKQEKKKFALLTSCISGAFLGCCLYFSALQINRLYSEVNHSISVIELKLTDIKHGTQYWSDESQSPISNEIIYINDSWDGYNNQLTVGQKYNISIHSGMFNDLFFNKDSFKQIKK
jgi:hypothetical protein